MNTHNISVYKSDIFKLLFKNLNTLTKMILDKDNELVTHERKDLVNTLLYILVCETRENKPVFKPAEMIYIQDKFDSYNRLNCPEIQHHKIAELGYFWSIDGFYFFKFYSMSEAEQSPNLVNFLKQNKFRYKRGNNIWYLKRFYSLNSIDFTLSMFLEKIDEMIELDNKLK